MNWTTAWNIMVGVLLAVSVVAVLVLVFTTEPKDTKPLCTCPQGKESSRDEAVIDVPGEMKKHI